MNNGALSEDFMEFDVWQEQDYLESTFTEGNVEDQLTRKIQSDDYFYRKQAFTETIIYIQNQQFYEKIPSLLNILKLICNDSESSLRSDLAESLISITKLCLSKESKDYNCVSRFSVPCIVIFLHDTNKQVRLTSHGALLNFIENQLIDKDLFYQHLWPSLEELMISYNPDELRTECFTLLVQISQLLDNCLEHKLLEFSKEFIASNDNLRKTSASYFCTLIDRCSDEFIMEWLDIFYKLSEDTSWYVKKFCIESAVSLSKRLSKEERWHNITNVYLSFLTDNKKWVTSSAYQNLGAFIATFANSNKSHCELSQDGRIVNLLSNCDKKEENSAILNEKGSNTSCPDYIDTNNYDSFSFWKQPTSTSSQKSDISTISLSIKDIDLNFSDQSTKSDNCLSELSEYDQDIIPMRLLHCYLNVIFESSDIDLIRPCAYSMPGIMFTLGPACWPFLRKAYVRLVQSISWKVRVCLASSIHHVFQIFQYNKSAVNDIIFAYKEFIKDVDEVKTGLMSNISQFFLSLSIDKYSEVFEDFNELTRLDSAKNWRYRVLCMEQLESVIVNIEIQSQSDIREFLKIFRNQCLSIVFSFVVNEVFAVRISAMDVMLKTMEKLGKWKTQNEDFENEELLLEINKAINSIKQKILNFSESKNWYMRQLFLQSCVKIVKFHILPQEIIEECLIPKYLDMCIHDSVPNNRMVGGLGLSSICNHKYLSELSESNRKKVEMVYNLLKIDADRDVRHSVMMLKEALGSLSPVDFTVSS